MARKYTIRSKEEKLSIVKRNLAGESAMSLSREIGSSDFPAFRPHRMIAGHREIHKILTEIPIFILAFSGQVGYYVLALRGNEC